MTTIFHLSDLHIVTSARWNRLRDCILDQAKQLSGERLLVVTGDFHNYPEADFQKAYDFLRELIAALRIKAAEDVFLIPGNHDVGGAAAIKRFFADDDGFDWDNWEYKQKNVVDSLKNTVSSDRFYPKRIADRLNAYGPYCAFSRELGVYPPDCGLLPATVHVRCWKNRLNILHLNTTLVYDPDARENQMMDIRAVSGDAVWEGFNPDLPVLALGHNSYYDLCREHQNILSGVFRRRGVCAYLCGDTHKEELDMMKRSIHYDSPILPIPNVVCVKGAADESDNYSDYGLYLHFWDEKTGVVKPVLLSWNPNDNQTSFTQVIRERSYYIPRPNLPLLLTVRDENKKLREELAKYRDEAREKDGPRPPDTRLEQQARELLAAGKPEEALELLSGPAHDEGLAVGEAETRRGQERARQYIQEELLKIEILQKKGLNFRTIPEIRAAYRRCVPLVKQHRISIHVLYDDLKFLDQIRAYAEAIDTTRWLLAHAQEEGEPEERLAWLNDRLGNLFRATNRLQEAEECYREALEIRSRLAKANLGAYKGDLIFGHFLLPLNRLQEAEARYREALEIHRRQAEANPGAYEGDLAMSCNNLGDLLYDTNRLQEAEARYWEALVIYSRLAEANPAAYEPDLATSCNNLGVLLRATNRLPEAEARYREALAIYRRLAEANPAAYEPDLAGSCYNLGLLLLDTKRKRKAKPLFREALNLWEKYPQHKVRADRVRRILNRSFN